MPNCGLNNNDFFVLTDEARALFGSAIGPDDTIVVVVPGTCRGDTGAIGLGGGNPQVSANYDLEATMAHEEGTSSTCCTPTSGAATSPASSWSTATTPA